MRVRHTDLSAANDVMIATNDHCVAGKVDEAVMLMDQQTKRHRGFGFVTFEHEETVDRVCEIHFHTIKNKKVSDILT